MNLNYRNWNTEEQESDVEIYGETRPKVDDDSIREFLTEYEVHSLLEGVAI